MQEEMTIEKAEKFFSDGEIRVAGNMAGVLLEQSVQKLCEFHRIPLTNGLRTRDLLDSLRDEGIISSEKNRELQILITIRNKCAHANPVTRVEVQKLIQGTKTFIRWEDTPSSIAAPRPLATQPPVIRKQLVCPICGKDNRVRKVSGITHHRLLEFPASSYRPKRDRLSDRERSSSFYGWVMLIFGVVLFCPLSIAPFNQIPIFAWLLDLGMFVSGLIMIIVPRRIAAQREKEDRWKAYEIWNTLYYCDRDDALYSPDRPGYYVSAAHMREMIRY